MKKGILSSLVRGAKAGAGRATARKTRPMPKLKSAMAVPKARKLKARYGGAISERELTRMRKLKPRKRKPATGRALQLIRGKG